MSNNDVQNQHPEWLDPEEFRFKRVPYPEHPDRCQANRGNHGQCLNYRIGVSRYCPAHGGNRANNVKRKQELAMYEKNTFLQSEEFKANPNLVSLTDEVAMMKAMINKVQATIKDDLSFQQHGAKLVDLITRADKLVISCNRLTEKLNLSMNAQQAMAWANEVLAIIGEVVQDADKVAEIQSRILASLDKAGGSDRVHRGQSDV